MITFSFAFNPSEKHKSSKYVLTLNDIFHSEKKKNMPHELKKKKKCIHIQNISSVIVA